MHLYRHKDRQSNCIRGVDISVIFYNASQNLLRFRYIAARLGKKEITSIFGLQGRLHNSKETHVEMQGMEIPYEKAGVTQVDWRNNKHLDGLSNAVGSAYGNHVLSLYTYYEMNF